jgi:ABC-type transport system involved in multi-copper enzyme maturation permease subunit/Tol biopolymer transport system component
MPSPTRALLWKEWREQRPIVVTGLVLSLLMPFFLMAGASTMKREIDFNALANVMPLFLALAMWPLLAAACGAATISSEIGDGTIGFLLSRPASRRRVWLVKVAVAVLALLAVIVGSLGVAALFDAVAPGDSSESVMEQVMLVQDYGMGEAFGVVFLTGGLLLLFAAAVFFSTFLSRAMTAAAAGVVSALGIISLIFVVWSRFDLMPRFEPGLVAIELGTATVLILLASLYVFARGEMLSGRGVLRYVTLGSLAAVAGLVVVSVPAFVAHTRLSPDDAVLLGTQIVPAGNAIVTTVVDEEGGSAQTWAIYFDGSGYQRLTPRLTGHASVSPDGEWVAYLSQRGPLGLRADSVSLRATRIDGTGDRLLAAPLPSTLLLDRFDEIRFSPDSRRVAVAFDHRSLVVASIDGREPVFIELKKLDLTYARVYGWTEDGTEVVIGSPGWQRIEGTAILAINPDTGDIRVVYQSPRRRAYLPNSSRSDSGLRLLPLALIVENGDGSTMGVDMLVVDVRSGEVAATYRSSGCGIAIDISKDGERMVYGDCRSDDEDDDRSRLHFRDLTEGADVATVDLEGRAWNAMLSPDGEWATVNYTAEQDGVMAPAAVHVSGRLRSFDDGWIPVGWSGRTGVVLARHDKSWGVRELAVADVETGEMRPVFP